jgi:hypothetical protein
MFDFNPLQVGNFATLSAWENDQEAKVHDMIKHVLYNYGYRVPSTLITEEINNYGIDFPNLPQWLKDEINDAFDCW